ncbi:hypothetical protein MK489_00805 [Myxococcota bacterium]|nr:hypothetical protein [Myxococcota bacterium]
MPLPPKICPRCGDEYLHRATQCTNCEIPLILEGEQVGAESVPQLPDVSELVCVRAAASSWILALAERMEEAGIPHRVEASGDTSRAREAPWGIFVRTEDAAAASAIDAEHMKIQMPDLPEGYDPRATESEDGEACPACGEVLAGKSDECPSCGLFLGSE